jgi:DNA-binding transcriptional ArsR family regulator
LKPELRLDAREYRHYTRAVKDILAAHVGRGMPSCAPTCWTASKTPVSRCRATAAAPKTAHDGIPPSLREIGDACAIASVSTVSYHLEKLRAAGLIRINPENTARNIEVVGARWLPPGEAGEGPLV